jgi:hypothetical protein
MMDDKSNEGAQYSYLSKKYYSYDFTYDGYTESNGENYSGYYSSESIVIRTTLFGDWNWKTFSMSDQYVTTTYGAIYKTEPSSRTRFKRTTNLHVAELTSDNNTYTLSDHVERRYILGDPRQLGGFTADIEHNTSSYISEGTFLYDYLVKCYSWSETKLWIVTNTYYERYVQTWGDKAGKIMIGGADDNILAPEIKLQSDYGLMVSNVSYDIAKKFCATYQEAGYPAGRWRMPTLAEMAYSMQLQKDRVINDQYISDNDYWTANGATIQLVKGSDLLSYPTNGTEASVRCVYDLWYWGDSPKSPTTTYYPEP